MFLESIFLYNFRLHKETTVKFSKSLNYIVGANAQGKTTLLEAIHLISTTKSFSNNKDKELITFGEDFYQIKGQIFDLIKDDVLIRYEYGENRKHYLLNGKPLNRPSEIIGRFPVVFLSPQDSLITEGTPSERRKLIDSIISQYNNSYLNNLLEYKKILRQRAALLSDLKENPNAFSFNELEIWTKRLMDVGKKIMIERKFFLDEFSEYLKRAFEYIRAEIETAEIDYATFTDNIPDDIEKDFLLLLEKEKYVEIKRAANLIGPHRDDFIFSINKINLKDFGSQGEHKTFQVAVRFAEYFYLRDKLNKNPIFLLDDVFGDLDLNRGKRISDYLSNLGQAFITMTDFTNRKELKKDDNDRIIIISNGSLNYE